MKKPMIAFLVINMSLISLSASAKLGEDKRSSKIIKKLYTNVLKTGSCVASAAYGSVYDDYNYNPPRIVGNTVYTGRVVSKKGEVFQVKITDYHSYSKYKVGTYDFFREDLLGPIPCSHANTIEDAFFYIRSQICPSADTMCLVGDSGLRNLEANP